MNSEGIWGGLVMRWFLVVLSATCCTSFLSLPVLATGSSSVNVLDGCELNGTLKKAKARGTGVDDTEAIQNCIDRNPGAAISFPSRRKSTMLRKRFI